MQRQEDILSSPLGKKQENEYKLLSTPETNKGKTPSYVLKYSKMKKSKRRECTPVYSPTHLTDAPKEEHFHFYTDKKGNYTFGKINFDSDLKLFQANTHFKADRSNFLELVEESLNEFNGTFLDVVGSQTTPDTIFTTLFNDNKENPEKIFQTTSKITQTEVKKVSDDIEAICNGLSKGDGSLFQSMKPKVIMIDSHCNMKEISLKKLEQNLIAFIINEKEVSHLTENMILVLGKVQLTLGFIDEKNQTIKDEKITLFKDIKLLFSIDQDLNVKLSCIEIHFF